MKVSMIAFDLDGTFLDDRKEIPPENIRAIERAAERGAYIVPATGRIYEGIPEKIKALPFMRYFLTINGAYVYDAAEDKILRRAELSAEESLRILDYADTQPVLYDCYQDNWGYMTRTMLERVEEYVDIPGILKLIKTLRTPVDSLPETIKQRGRPVQKLQLYVPDAADKARIMRELEQRFPDIAVSSSVSCNIEINSREATKGQALLGLCRHLNIPPEEVIAFGDGSNDADMLRAAGLGVAVANAEEEVKAAADLITQSNNDCGVARVIERFI